VFNQQCPKRLFLNFQTQKWSVYGSITATFYLQLLHAQIPKLQKRQVCHKYLFAILESVHVKAVRKTLVKLTLEKNTGFGANPTYSALGWVDCTTRWPKL
jgi:hypothetical protein